MFYISDEKAFGTGKKQANTRHYVEKINIHNISNNTCNFILYMIDLLHI